MFTSKHSKFLDDLEDKEYRQVFAEELIGTSLAFQIRRMRDARQWSQEELGERTDKAQPTISQWENPDYGRYSLTTLKELAGAFDVGLLVRFVSFSELADWTVNVPPLRLSPPSYAEERQLSFTPHDSPFTWPSSDDEPIADLDGWERDLLSAVDQVAKSTRESKVFRASTIIADADEGVYEIAAD